MPQDDLYWNAVELDSDDSFNGYPSNNKQSYIDPWDLENYAYIREHLDSMELSSNPSLPVSSSSGELAEANSTSFFYVPGNKASPKNGEKRIYDSFINDQGNYADIDELKVYDRNRRPKSEYVYGSRRVERNQISNDIETDTDESPYGDSLPKEGSVFGIYDRNGHFRRVAVPVTTETFKVQRDRSLSFSYGDYEYDPYSTKHEIYSRLDDVPRKMETPIPIYDDIRRNRRKPNNFGLSSYGHLKIDYSYSWNNLNKYIKYNH